MDKRWRNLGVLLVVIVALAAGYYFFYNLKAAPAQSDLIKQADVSISLLSKADVNYAELKIAVETFNYSLDLHTLDLMKQNAGNDLEMKYLIGIEERENAVFDEYSALAYKDFPYLCEDIGKSEPMLEKAFSIVEDLDAHLSANGNPLRLNPAVLYESYREMEADSLEMAVSCNNAADVLEDLP